MSPDWIQQTSIKLTKETIWEPDEAKGIYMYVAQVLMPHITNVYISVDRQFIILV
jgi:hypothetical protein